MNWTPDPQGCTVDATMMPSHTTCLLLCCGALAACAGGGATCVPEGTPIAVSRTNGAGACPSAAVAGVTALTQTFTPKKNLACGVDHDTLTVDFFAQDANHTSCTGSDAIAFPDFGPDGGSGTDTMSITCDGGTTCTETFDVTFTPQ
jgi:hypothetical protein